MISLDCHHPDLLEFIDKKANLDSVTKANISVRITDDFMKAVKNNEEFTLSFTRPETGDTVSKVINAREVFMRLCENNNNFAEPGILFWDRISNYNLLSEVDNFEYAGTNPCAEEPLPAGGSCLLGAINLSEFVVHPFGYDGQKPYVDLGKLSGVVEKVVKELNVVLDEGLELHPLEIQKECVRKWRQIGLGIMGLADMLIKLGIRYGSEDALIVCNSVGYTMANIAIRTSAKLAMEYGKFEEYSDKVLESDFFIKNTDDETKELVKKYGLRNSQLLTIAPTGSISNLIGVSGGIEPIFATHYERKTESLHDEGEVIYKVYTPIVQEYMELFNLKDETELPEYFVTAQQINYKARVNMQAIWQEHIDASISSTVNVPNDFTVEDAFNMYLYAYESGVKGLTMYRDGCERVGVLTVEKKNEDKNIKETTTENLKDHDLIGLKRKLITGCGSLHVTAHFDRETGRLFETFLDKGSTGGCNNYMVGLSRMISKAAKKGATVEEIVDQLLSTGVCPSYNARRIRYGDTSKGTCCPMAVGHAIVEMYDEMKEIVRMLHGGKTIVEKEVVEEVKEENKVTSSSKANSIMEEKVICKVCGTKMNPAVGCFECPVCGETKCS